jgi:hypothetical protein
MWSVVESLVDGDAGHRGRIYFVGLAAHEHRPNKILGVATLKEPTVDSPTNRKGK